MKGKKSGKKRFRRGENEGKCGEMGLKSGKNGFKEAEKEVEMSEMG